MLPAAPSHHARILGLQLRVKVLILSTRMLMGMLNMRGVRGDTTGGLLGSNCTHWELIVVAIESLCS